MYHGTGRQSSVGAVHECPVRPCAREGEATRHEGGPAGWRKPTSASPLGS